MAATKKRPNEVLRCCCGLEFQGDGMVAAEDFLDIHIFGSTCCDKARMIVQRVLMMPTEEFDCLRRKAAGLPERMVYRSQ